MTILARVASGSMSAWVQIIVNMLLQITLVPLFLSQWDTETYGVWQMIQATVTLATMFDIGHQTFLGNEFSRVGHSDRRLIAKMFYSSLPVGALVSFMGLLIVGCIVATTAQQWLFGLDVGRHRDLLNQAGLALLIQASVWLILVSTSAIAVRALIPFGHYTRLTWWGICSSIVTWIAPAVAVTLGSDLLLATIVQGMATALFYIPVFVDYWRTLKCERILPVRPDWALGFRNFSRSLIVTARLVLDMARLQGMRLMLSPIVGLADMVVFTTMRTGANVALQGIGTITNPLLPELMRFLRLKDQDRIEASFAMVWLVVVLAMGPAVILLQWLAPPLIDTWTRGKIHFDPVLFAMLSVVVLIYALEQPALAVVQGNNLLGSQLGFSGLASATVIGGLLLLVPKIGIRGAAIALIAGEAVSLIGYTIMALSWLKSNSIQWPTRQFSTVASSVVLTSIGLFRVALAPHDGEVIISMTLTGNLALLALYWSQLPKLARARACEMVALFLGAYFAHQKRI